MNLALAALDSFYTQLKLGCPVVRREDLPAKAPRALTEEQVRRLLRMCERATARDRAIVVMLLYTGLRLAELVALDLDDVRVWARKGLVIVAASGRRLAVDQRWLAEPVVHQRLALGSGRASRSPRRRSQLTPESHPPRDEPPEDH